MTLPTTRVDTDTIGDYYTIIPHPTEARVLLIAGDGGYALPHLVPHKPDFAFAEPINRAMKIEFGLDVTTLACVYHANARDDGQGRYAFALETHSPNWKAPVDARWIGQDELTAVQGMSPEQCRMVETYFDWLADDSPRRVPWSRGGWFDEAVAWIDSQLAALGLEASGPVEQVRTWARSCTLRVNTKEGRFYFNAVPSSSTYVAVVTRVLAQRHPDNIPQVLAVDVAQGWMLLRAFDGTPLAGVQDIGHWEEAVRQYARIQIDLTDHTQNLVALGCPDRHVDQITMQIDRLLGDNDLVSPDSHNGLTRKEFDSLHDRRSELKSMCYDLLLSDIPMSLEHGNFRPDNVIESGSHWQYFDWTESAVTHPFFDMFFFLLTVEAQLPDHPDARTRLRDAYLESWTAYQPLEALIQVFQTAMPVAALHHALIYHRFVLPRMESRARWQIAPHLNHLLRLLLDLMEQSSL